jgi:hypothetical protein
MMRLTLHDLLCQSGYFDVFPTSSAEEAWTKSTHILVRIGNANDTRNIVGTSRIGDDLTIHLDD